MPVIDDLIAQKFPGAKLIGEPTSKKDELTGQALPGGTQYTAVIEESDGTRRTITLESQGNAGPLTGGVIDFNLIDAGKGEKPAGETPSVAAANQGQAEQAQAAAAKSRQELKALQDLDANRQGNVAKRGLYLTDEEIATMDAKLRDQGQTKEQIDNALKIAGDNNKTANVSNQIAAQNAATAASTAAHNAKIAELRLSLDENKNASDADLRAAQLAYDKERDDLNRQLASDQLALQGLTQRQTNEVQQGQLGVQQGQLKATEASGAETVRSNQAREQQAKADAAQRAAETKQTAETAERTSAINAASGVYSAERTAQSQAGTTGASLINQRVQTAQGMLNNVLGLAGQGQSSSGKFGPLGGGLHAMPAGFDASQMLSGIGDYTAALGGGQQVYDAAANMVKRAGGDIQSPQGQAAYGVLGQMLERYKALTGQDHPAAAAAGAAAATTPATGVASPPAAAPAAAMGGAAAAPAVAAPVPAQAFASPPPVMTSRGTEGVGNPWAGGQTPAPGTTWQNPAFASPPPRTVTITV